MKLETGSLRAKGVVLGVVLLVAVAGAVVLRSRSTPLPHSAGSGPTEVIEGVPASIAADCSRPVQREIADYIRSVPDGSTIRFPAAGCYAQDSRIEIRQKRRLTILGNGATFRSSTPNDNNDNQPNWYLFKSTGISMTDMVIIGNFHDTGAPSVDRGSVVSNAGVSVYGGGDITLTDLNISDVFGDGVQVAKSWVEDTFEPEVPSNVRVSRLKVNTAARHCVSTSQVVGFWLEDSELTRCFLFGLDAERDVEEDPLTDLHFLRNTFSDNFGGGLYVPIGGRDASPSSGVEIRGNRFLTLNTAAVCNQQVYIGAYPGQSHTNVVIEDNEMVAWMEGIVLTNTLSGSVQNNKITRDPKSAKDDCGVGRNDYVGLLDSSRVVVSENGPDVTPSKVLSTPSSAPSAIPTPATTPKDTQPPSAPSSLSALSVAPNGVALAWSAATDNVAVAKYYVQRDGVLIAETKDTAYTDASIEAAKSYSYLVYAVDTTANPGPGSNATTIRVP